MTEEELNNLEASALSVKEEVRRLFPASVDEADMTILVSDVLSLIALARVGLAVAENAKLIDDVLEQADADSHTVDSEFGDVSEEERTAIAHVRTVLLSSLPKPGGE